MCLCVVEDPVGPNTNLAAGKSGRSKNKQQVQGFIGKKTKLEGLPLISKSVSLPDISVCVIQGGHESVLMHWPIQTS